MASENLEFIIDLKDKMTSQLHNIEGELESVNKGLESGAHHGHNFVASFAEYRLIEKTFELITEGVKEYQGISVGNAQISNSIKNLGIQGKITSDELVEQQEELHNKTGQSMIDLVQTQQGLLKYQGDLVQQNILKITNVALDAAKAHGESLQGTSDLIARIINREEPLDARRAQQLGLQKEQIQAINNAYANNIPAKATELLLKYIGDANKGAAELSLQANPLGRINIIFENIKEQIGAVATNILKLLTPALNFLQNNFKDIIDTVISLVIVFASIKTFSLIVEAIKFATEGWQVAQALLNDELALTQALETSTGISLIVGAISLLVTGLVIAYNHFEKFRNVVKGVFEFSKDVVWGFITSIASVGRLVYDLVTFNFKGAYNDFVAIGGNIYSGIKSGVADSLKDYNSVDSPEESKKDSAKNKGGYNLGAKLSGTSISNQSVESVKATNVNINIGSLVKELNIKSDKLSESTEKIRQIVTDVLLSTVRDSQILIK